MCIPCGPRGRGWPGRTAFTTVEDVLRYPLEQAMDAYPDNEAAMAQLKAFIDVHIDHTEKWIVNELYDKDKNLIRIGVIPENLTVLKAYYKQKKAAWKAAKG